MVARLHKVCMFWPLMSSDIQDTEAPNLHFLEFQDSRKERVLIFLNE